MVIPFKVVEIESVKIKTELKQFCRFLGIHSTTIGVSCLLSNVKFL